MNERLQRLLWTVLAVTAVALSAVTVHLCRQSRGLSAATEQPKGRIAYVAFSETTYIPQLYTCDLQGGDVRPLVESRAGDLLPVCEPLQAAQARVPRIAFVRFTSDPGSGTGTQMGAAGGVYVVSSDGGHERKVSGNVPRLPAVAPAWSSDGSQLAFAGAEDLNGDGKYTTEEAGIYVCDAEGAQVKRVATVHATGMRLQWSPTRAELILQVHKPVAPVPVAHLLDLRTGELTSRDDATTVGCWSPNGQYIAAYSMIDRKIHVLSSAGDELWTSETPPGYVTDLHWLPASDDGEDEGRFLALCAPEPNSGWGQLNQSSALIARGDAPSWRPLTDEQASVAYVVPSPDGRWAVFTLMAGEDTEIQADLYLLNLAQGQPQQLTQDPGYESMATWVPLRTK